MGSGKGQSKRVNVATAKGRFKVTKPDHDLFKAFGENNVRVDKAAWTSWVNANGLSAITYSDYYLGKSAPNPTDEQLGFVLTQVFHELIHEKMIANYEGPDPKVAAEKINYNDYSVTFKRTKKTEKTYSGAKVDAIYNVYELIDKKVNKPIAIFEQGSAYNPLGPSKPKINEKIGKGKNDPAGSHPFAVVSELFKNSLKIEKGENI